jgi:hypothetical protein
MAQRNRTREVFPEVRRELNELLKEGMGGAETHRRLEGKFAPQGIPIPSLRTVQRMVQEVNGRKDAPWQKLLASPFEWHRIEEYHLSWECSRYLLDMYLQTSHYWSSAVKVKWMGSPTVRQVRWWWRVHLATPEVEGVNLIVLAQRFVGRELAHDVLGVPLEMADLDALLTCRPWIGEWSHGLYLLAVKNGDIPPLRFDPEQVARNAEKIKELSGEVVIPSAFLDQLAEGFNPECPELLLGQQIEQRRSSESA